MGLPKANTLLGHVDTPCKSCPNDKNQEVRQNGPHRMAECSECGSWIRNLSRNEEIRPVMAGEAHCVPSTSALTPRQQLAHDLASRWLAALDELGATDIQYAVSKGFHYADVFFAEAAK